MKRSPEYTIRHLEALQAWGYTLSDVDEELLTASRAELAELAAEAADDVLGGIAVDSAATENEEAE